MNAGVQSVFAPLRFALPRVPVPAVKTFTYMVMHLVVAMAVAYALTGSWAAALAIGLIEPAVQTLAYTVHEKGWAKWGRGRAASPSPVCGHPHGSV